MGSPKTVGPPKCAICPSPVPAEKGRRKYCSIQCMKVGAIEGIKANRQRARRQPEAKACEREGCGVTFTTNLPHKKYCGPLCVAIAHQQKFSGGK